MEKFKNNSNPSEQVYIVDQVNDQIVLNNGLQISSSDFIRSYTPVSSPDPSQLFNEIQKNKHLLDQKMTNPMNKPVNFIKQNDEIDPNAFFNSSANRLLEESRKLENIDLSQIRENPQSQGSIVIDKTQYDNNDYNLEERARQARDAYNRDAAANGQPTITIAPRLSNEDLSRFRPVNEDDPNSVNGFIAQNQPPKPQTGPIDPETGLDSRKTEIRKRQMAATGEDPYAEDVARWKSNRGNRINSIPMNTAIPHLEQSEYNPNISNNTNINPQFDVMTMILNKFKKNYDIKISFSIKEKIPNPEFLKLATENIDGDIVDFYTEEFMKNFLSNMPEFRNNIYKQIYKEVYGIALDEKKKKIKIDEIKEGVSVEEIKVDEVEVKPEEKPLIEDKKTKVIKKSTKTKKK